MGEGLGVGTLLWVSIIPSLSGKFRPEGGGGTRSLRRTFMFSRSYQSGLYKTRVLVKFSHSVIAILSLWDVIEMECSTHLIYPHIKTTKTAQNRQNILREKSFNQLGQLFPFFSYMSTANTHIFVHLFHINSLSYSTL